MEALPISHKRRRRSSCVSLMTNPLIGGLLFFGSTFVAIFYWHVVCTLEDSNTGHHNPLALFLSGQRLLPSLSNAAQQPQQDRQHTSKLPPMTLQEITDYLHDWIPSLHAHLQTVKKEKAEGIWDAYYNLTLHTLYPWDQQYLQRMPPRRDDHSIFLSLASYRDENCFHTLQGAYQHAAHPERLFVGLVQQNCVQNCRTGIMEDGKSHEQVEPDPDCYQLFCDSEIGRPHCEAHRVRALLINEPESLGPYAARYFASKLWYGETWFMQTDAHMTFADDWDDISIQGLFQAPSPKPVLSHYPPGHTVDLNSFQHRPSARLCGPIFTSSIIRLEGNRVYDHVKLDIPRFAPFMGAGYFVAHSSFLSEVPMDPFLPWIFMGEEIILSSRLWTSGYDIFSPAQSVVGHIYVRRHKPKFWESVHRAFSPGVHNPLQELVLERIRHQLLFPESARDMLQPKSVLTAVEQYSMGSARPLDDYLRIIGVNTTTKEITDTHWCEQGTPPPGFDQYAPLYHGDNPS